MKKRIIIFSIIILLILSTTIFAFEKKLTERNPTAPEEISNMSLDLLGALQWIGYAIALGMIIYVGIKYTMSAANEKANLKQSTINYVIGAIIIASCTTILSFVVDGFDAARGREEMMAGGDEECSHKWELIHYDSRLNTHTRKCQECGATQITHDET